MSDIQTSLLIRNPLAVMSGLPGKAARLGAVDIRIQGGLIQAMGPALEPLPGERLIDATDCLVYPGWVNTHHHLFQSVLKGVPAGIDQPLASWLACVPHHFLPRLRPEQLRVAARIGLIELLLSGTTTCADHHYVYYPGVAPAMTEVLFDEAESLGMRLVLCRGGTLAGHEHPGFSANADALAPETLDGMLRDVERLAGQYHDPRPDAMRRVVMAPTTPTFSLAPAQLRETAQAARSLGLRLHSHLSETRDYVDFCHAHHGMEPVEFVAEHGWLGPDVWFAHLVHLTAGEIDLLASTGTGMAHCPSSNCRLGSGIAPAPALAAAGAPVSLAVDGAASNEAGGMLHEVHLAWLLHRAVHGPAATRAEDIINWGSVAGAGILGLDALGGIAPGMAADLVVYELDDARHQGFHDPALIPVISGAPLRVRHSLVGGRLVVENGSMPDFDAAELKAQAKAVVQALSR